MRRFQSSIHPGFVTKKDNEDSTRAISSWPGTHPHSCIKKSLYVAARYNKTCISAGKK